MDDLFNRFNILLELLGFLAGGSLDVLLLDREETEELLEEDSLRVALGDRRRSVVLVADRRLEGRWQGEIEGCRRAEVGGGRWVFGRRGVVAEEREEKEELLRSSSGGTVAGGCV